jgi:hypothetical protein
MFGSHKPGVSLTHKPLIVVGYGYENDYVQPVVLSDSSKTSFPSKSEFKIVLLPIPRDPMTIQSLYC